jgi:NAD(P)-dependent dehydrogenase (short-subunit alcohol dehydrogenase family)
MQKTWFITGASSGFGKMLVDELLKNEQRVIATFRQQIQADSFSASNPELGIGVVLNVNYSDKIHALIQRVITQYGKIDVVVNNAGYGLTGAIEDASDEEVRAQMETNFFGALKVTQEFLPHFRQNKAGLFIQISSQAGIVGVPGLGIYNASKFALEGFSEALSREAAHLGIKIMIVEPGPFRTNWAGSSMIFTSTETAEYAQTAGATKQRLQSISGDQPGDPIKGVQLIIEAALSENPPLRLPLGTLAIQIIRSKLKQVESDILAWENKSKQTNY